VALPIRPDAPRRGGALRLPLAGIETLDPARSASISENLIIQQLFQGLVRFDTHLRVVPDLASSWTLSDDRLTYTFHLDPRARFHDGSEVTSADVKTSLLRIMDRRLRSPARAYLMETLPDPDEAIECPDPRTVVVRLVRPDHVFIRTLAMQHTRIVPAHLCDERDFARSPVGSGPFRLLTREEGKLEIAPAFEDRENGPYVDRVIFLQLTGEQERAQFLSSEIDYTVAAASERRFFEALGDSRLWLMPTLTLHFLALNVSKPPLDDPEVRRGLALALDRSALETKTQGRVQAARTVLPPGMPGHDAKLDPYPHDPDRARELLAAARFPEGSRVLTILLGRIPEQEAVITILEEQLAAVGIGLDVSKTDDLGLFLRDLNRYDLGVVGWSADYPDPDNFFYNLFRTGAPYNFMGYSSTPIDELVEQGRRGEGKIDRARIYRRAEETLQEDCPVVPLFHDAALHCVSRRVHGLRPTALGIYYTRLDEVWIEEEDEGLPALRPPGEAP
jgi:peptide/nickel transport system substrate-binding protein